MVREVTEDDGGNQDRKPRKTKIETRRLVGFPGESGGWRIHSEGSRDKGGSKEKRGEEKDLEEWAIGKIGDGRSLVGRTSYLSVGRIVRESQTDLRVKVFHESPNGISRRTLGILRLVRESQEG